MDNTYNYLMNAWQEVRKNNLFVLLASLVLITIPLPYIFNSIAIIVFTLFTIFKYKTNKFVFQISLVFPIALYFLMILSLFWTIDFKISLEALTKELPLLILPVCFFTIPLSSKDKYKIITVFSYSILMFCVFYLVKAVIRYFLTKDTAVFFYHELVSLDVNAIHVSVYCVVAFFCFLLKSNKTNLDKMALLIFSTTIFLLSSKNIIIVFILLLLIYVLIHAKTILKNRFTYILIFITIALFLLFSKNISKRFEIEILSNTSEKTINQSYNNQGVVYNVTVNDAWNKERFQPNDFFPGTALRVYQIRIFLELLQEENIFFNGYGLNASWLKLKEKRTEHNLFVGYEKFNFHNQYIQNFAELGVFGFLILVVMALLTLNISIKNKDFMHFSFAILMISLFLTESFLWRQRGVVFFTMMYCLFNIRIQAKNPEKEIQTTL